MASIWTRYGLMGRIDVIVRKIDEGLATVKRSVGKVEATSGFEPLNRGFADLPLNHLGTSPRTRSHLRWLCRLGEPAVMRSDWLPLEDSNLA